MIEAIRRRQVATDAIARFRGVPLAFGTADCARLGTFVLYGMGHRSPLAQAMRYRTAGGAGRALRKRGFDTLLAAIDSIGLGRIPPAAALPADLIMLPGEDVFGGSLTMAVGNGRVLGYHEDMPGAEILQPAEYLAAWRL
ncbi:MAG: hypothetical protein M3Y22_15155 [Pseudomonadota bacterium]|nr:hypothetical protein [Pseudomonadota bacterium]